MSNSEKAYFATGCFWGAERRLWNLPGVLETSVGYMGVTTTAVQLNSDKTGSGSYLPMTFVTSGTEAARFDTGGNLLVGTTNANGANTLTTSIIGGIHQTIKGVTNATNAATVTLFTLPSPGYSTWIVSIAVSASSGQPASYNRVAIITQSSTVAVATTLVTTSASTLTVSGLAVQATQSSGATQDIYWSAVRIF
jgi:hypothetical protein